MFVGESANFSCAVYNFNPPSLYSIKWYLGDSAIFQDISLEFQNGSDFGGYSAISNYVMTVTEDYNDKLLSCVPVWNDVDVDSLTLSGNITVFCKYKI